MCVCVCVCAGAFIYLHTSCLKRKSTCGQQVKLCNYTYFYYGTVLLTKA